MATQNRYRSEQIERMRRRRRKKKLILTLFTLVFLAASWFAVLYFFQKPTVTISPQRKFAVGEKVSLYDLVLKVEQGKLISEDEILDSQKPGTREVTLIIEDRLGIMREENFVIEFYDNIPPTIEAPAEISVLQGQEPDLLKDVFAKDENGVNCIVSVSGDFDTNQAGEYTLTLSASDSAGNTASQTMKLIVSALPYNEETGKISDGEYITSKGFPLVVKDGITYIDGYLIANKTYTLPKTYTSSWLSPETQDAYNQLQKAASAAGYSIPVRSAYRSWQDQERLFTNYSRADGVKEAETYSARPGHSEHQTGLALDILTADSEAAKKPENAVVFAWLSENAHKYGFILRYPEGKTSETGYIYEPWHFRYVGTELAQILYNNGDWITMEDYFGIDSVYRGYDN